MFVRLLAVVVVWTILPVSPIRAAEVMVASWYDCCNPETANNIPFDKNNPHIAAHKTLPFGTELLLRRRNMRVCVEIQDRGPFVEGRDLDLTEAGAIALGFKKDGIATLGVVVTDCLKD
ncbi:septal ring lytic transglycosylase RlpA family lipoprotein [Acetobacteraceae bacterium]|nr:septal ring lytic transglycosylase RlpA family lipoprotein [Candidatus Parcubacteria bacterium]